MLPRVWKHVKIMAKSGIWALHFWLPNRVEIRYMYFTRHQRLCRLELCASWAVLGKGKKVLLLNWIFSFRKVFLLKNNNPSDSWEIKLLVTGDPKDALLYLFLQNCLMNFMTVNRVLQLIAKCKWSQIIELQRVLLNNWSYFTFSGHLFNFTAIIFEWIIWNQVDI